MRTAFSGIRQQRAPAAPTRRAGSASSRCVAAVWRSSGSSDEQRGLAARPRASSSGNARQELDSAVARTMAGCSGLSASRISSGSSARDRPARAAAQRRPVVRLARLAVPLARRRRPTTAAACRRGSRWCRRWGCRVGAVEVGPRHPEAVVGPPVDDHVGLLRHVALDAEGPVAGLALVDPSCGSGARLVS